MYLNILVNKSDMINLLKISYIFKAARPACNKYRGPKVNLNKIELHI